MQSLYEKVRVYLIADSIKYGYETRKKSAGAIRMARAWTSEIPTPTLKELSTWGPNDQPGAILRVAAKRELRTRGAL